MTAVVPVLGQPYNTGIPRRSEHRYCRQNPNFCSSVMASLGNSSCSTSCASRSKSCEVQSPLRALSRLTRESFAGLYVDLRTSGRRLSNRQAAAERAHPGGHARRHRGARQRQHDHLGQRPAARVDRARKRRSARTSTRCSAAPKSSAPTSVRSTRRWPPAGASSSTLALERQPLLPRARRAGVRRVDWRRST